MAQSLTLGTSAIRQIDGLYSLNDLHQAAGNEAHKRPNQFLRRNQTKELINAIEHCADSRTALKVVNGGAAPGTYACRELVIAYAAWISPEFHLKVIRVFLQATAPDAQSHASESEILVAFILQLIDSGRLDFNQMSGIAHKSNGRLLQMVDQAVISDKVRAIRSQIHGLNLAELHMIAELSGSLATCEAAVIRKNGKTSEQLMEARR